MCNAISQHQEQKLTVLRQRLQELPLAVLRARYTPISACTTMIMADQLYRSGKQSIMSSQMTTKTTCSVPLRTALEQGLQNGEG